MAAPASNPTPMAVITGQTETVDRDGEGRVVPGVRVTFRTAKGVQGSVFVPKQGYNRQVALDAVRLHAAELDTIQGAELH